MRSVFLIGLACCAALASPGICSISIDGDEDEGAGGGDSAAVVNSDESVEEQLGDPGEEGPVAEDGEADDEAVDNSDGESDEEVEG